MKILKIKMKQKKKQRKEKLLDAALSSCRFPLCQPVESNQQITDEKGGRGNFRSGCFIKIKIRKKKKKKKEADDRMMQQQFPYNGLTQQRGKQKKK